MLRRDIRGGTSGSPTPGLDAWHQMNPDARVGEFDPMGTKVARRRGLRGATLDAQGQNELVGELVWGDFLDRLRGNIRGQGGNQNPSGSPTGQPQGQPSPNPSPSGAGTNVQPGFLNSLMSGYNDYQESQKKQNGLGPVLGPRGQGQSQPNPVAQASGFGPSSSMSSQGYSGTTGDISPSPSGPGSQPPPNFDPGFTPGAGINPQEIASWFNPTGAPPAFASQGFGVGPIDSPVPGQQFNSSEFANPTGAPPQFAMEGFGVNPITGLPASGGPNQFDLASLMNPSGAPPDFAMQGFGVGQRQGSQGGGGFNSRQNGNPTGGPPPFASQGFGVNPISATPSPSFPTDVYPSANNQPLANPFDFMAPEINSPMNSIGFVPDDQQPFNGVFNGVDSAPPRPKQRRIRNAGAVTENVNTANQGANQIAQILGTYLFGKMGGYGASHLTGQRAGMSQLATEMLR